MRAAGFAVEAEGEASYRCDRGPGDWRLLQERGARCSELGGSGAGSGGAEKGAGFWVRSLEAFPRGKRLFFSHSFPTSFPGQSSPVPRPFPVIFGSPPRQP